MDKHNSSEQFVGKVEPVTATTTSVNNDSNAKSAVRSAGKHTCAVLWCVYALWCMMANNYGKTTGSSVLGIPEFRKDFGQAFNGNYVLPATWQAAYYGAPQAA